MKGVVDRFSEEFVETRMKALDKFLKRVADHPVLSFNPHLNAFLSAKVRGEGKGGGNGRGHVSQKRRTPWSVHLSPSCCHSVPAGPEQASGSGPADQGGRVRQTRGGRLQAAGAANRVLRHGGIPGHLQPETGNHRPHRPEDPKGAVRYRPSVAPQGTVDNKSEPLLKRMNLLELDQEIICINQ